jgi:hypothetical protein
MSRQIHTNSDPSVTDESFEEASVILDEADVEMERDLATEELFDTQHGDGHTYNPEQAQEQGLTWTPPDDPPVLPSDDPQGAEIATGYAQSMEASRPDEEELPDDGIDNIDTELQNDVYEALRNNSETMDLGNVAVRVRDGIVTLLGTVPADNDIALIEEIVRDLDGVVDVRSRLDVED